MPGPLYWTKVIHPWLSPIPLKCSRFQVDHRTDVLPSHPLRVAWLVAYDNLVIHAAFDQNMSPKDIRDEFSVLDGAMFPLSSRVWTLEVPSSSPIRLVSMPWAWYPIATRSRRPP